MKIVADINIPFLKGVLEPFAEVVYLPGKDIIAEVIKDADALIIRTRTNCNAELLEGSAVKFIATATIGFDHIDTDYCASRGIKWTNAPGCNSGSVMQYMATALAHLSEKYSFDYKDKTMGIVGVGNVGTKVARLATILGMNVLLNDPPRMRKEEKEDFVSLKEIQKKADIISFHVPLNKKGPDKTYHLFDEHFLEGIKAGTIIMNTSRGKVVKTEALKKGLKKEKIKAAVVDVWEKEPDIDTELLQLVDIGTPHIAGYSTDGKAMGTALSVQAISRFFGFGLDNWYLENIPSVSNKEIKMDCRGLSRQEIVNKAILATYDLLKDDTTLRNSPETFEKQREKYPVRREFGVYNTTLTCDDKNITELLNKLGFNK